MMTMTERFVGKFRSRISENGLAADDQTAMT